ncbi:MAG: hydantoinase/oxoprolinase family protein [Clostridiales bacterium]|jgi:N-methylhydantoinase A/oxoprolinase/acetone carboxylase beta subunit|nr:hydantoinase/oxoprolinase family protein [Clostridiales bacterium]
MGKVRIGIDVGGTFTDAVIIDNDTFELLAKRKIPTTHDRGVAHGVVRIITLLMEENGIAPEDVAFIAHGTTQATNALLEGDVASVGVIGMAEGIDAVSARKETDIGDIELAYGKYLQSAAVFVDTKNITETAVNYALDELLKKGAQVIVASGAFSVDDPSKELMVMKEASRRGLYCTGGHEISQLYGLRMRTRTAVVNASLIPKMMETANMTERAVRDTRIESNLMIMRCDGGVMSIDEVRKRPILTMLSGLAAGVAGALMYEKVTDGIFFEAGGTSVDISVIKNGKVMIKYAQVGGHKTYLQSLDVRTLGLAGGSMIRIKDGVIVDVGPRSAHIAGMEYECFTQAEDFSGAAAGLVSPRTGDPREYAAIKAQNGKDYALTLAGAANLLGYVPEGDYARGSDERNRAAWGAFGEYLGCGGEAAARRVIDLMAKKLSALVEGLIKEYELNRNMVTLVGGGGSGSVVVAPLAENMGIKHTMAKNAPYISTIGVALAMVREQMERTVLNPAEADIKKIRADIIERIVRSGANESTVDVSIEVDAQKNILRAIAVGATELRRKNPGAAELADEQLAEISAQIIGADKSAVSLLHKTGRWSLYKGVVEKKLLGGLIKRKTKSLAMLDREGVVRLCKENAACLKFIKAQQDKAFNAFLDENTTYSDANATIPKVFMFYKEKMLDLTGMQTASQLYSVLNVETEALLPEEELIAVAYK